MSSFLRQTRRSPSPRAGSSRAPLQPDIAQRPSHHWFTDDEAEAGESSDTSHPLYSSHLTDDDDAASDVSRPTLRRLTSETERQLLEHAESSRSGASHSEGASNRGSLDLLRMSPAEGDTEVEVLVHHVKPTESLAGIALLYGIDLSILRKVNKLWSNDSIHSRTRLYIPIEACKWNKASETFIRGPGPGQITLVAKNPTSSSSSSNRKGKTPLRSRETSFSADNAAGPSRRISTTSPDPWIQGLDDSDEWDSVRAARQFLESTNATYDRLSSDTTRPSQTEIDSPAEAEREPERRIVDVVRIPNSQLRFFPRPQKPPDTNNTRRSLEQDMRRVSLERGARRSVSLKQAVGARISNDLSTLPSPFQPGTKGASGGAGSGATKMVKIRPGAVNITAGSTLLKASSSAGAIAENLASRFSSFFDIPPPPDQDPRFSTLPRYGAGNIRPKMSFDGGRSGIGPLGTSNGPPRRSSEASTPIHPDVSLEMRPTAGLRAARANGKTNKKLD